MTTKTLVYHYGTAPVHAHLFAEIVFSAFGNREPPMAFVNIVAGERNQSGWRLDHAIRPEPCRSIEMFDITFMDNLPPRFCVIFQTLKPYPDILRTQESIFKFRQAVPQVVQRALSFANATFDFFVSRGWASHLAGDSVLPLPVAAWVSEQPLGGHQAHLRA